MLWRRVFSFSILIFAGLFSVPTAHAQRVAIGYSHSCFITPASGVRCMGRNVHGQLGDGSYISRTVPSDVPGVANVSAIVAGSSHTCALTQSNQVWCWGDDGADQLGIGDTPASDMPTPQLVTFPNGFVTTLVAAGGSHTCALGSNGLYNGLVYCWGRNSDGEVDGGTGNRSVPTSVALEGAAHATALSLGLRHTCARTQSGGIQCWGYNDHGQLGRDTSNEIAPFKPKAVPQIAGVPNSLDAIAAGNGHTCAITSGSVKCWGDNYLGQLGVGTTDSDHLDSHPTPVSVINLNNATIASLHAGNDHTCAAIVEAGAAKLRCWGRNFDGQLGNGNFGINPTPSIVNSSVEFGSSPAWSSGHDTNCVLDASSTHLRCWGSDDEGQFGNRMRGYSDAPRVMAPLVGGATASALEVGDLYACVRTTDGHAQCWGYNGDGQIGDYTSGNLRPLPRQVGSASFTVGTLAASTDHTCSTIAGEVSCWGDNSHGKLGDGTTIAKSEPVAVKLLGNTYVVNGQLSLGVDHSCAITDQDVQCWGANYHGQLGDGSGNGSLTPVSVDLQNAAVASRIDSGAYHSCVVTTAQKVQCWGENSSGQLGVGGSPTSPQEVPLANGALAASVSAASSHSCALSPSGHIQCWGNNYDGKLGIGSLDDSSAYGPTPIDAPASLVFTSLSIGEVHSCAVSSAGEVWCWGGNRDGAIAGRSGQISYPSPLKVHLLGEPAVKATSVGAGADFTCAFTTIGIQCWGDNTYGQLGNGDHGAWPVVNAGVDVMDPLFANDFE